MTINLNGLPESLAAPAPQSRAGVVVVSTASVNDGGASARQQLTNAVPAPVQVAAYAPFIPQQPKPVIRTSSSALAAQFISQGALTSEEDLALFEPAKPVTLPPTAEDEAGNDFIAAMRMARGEFTPANLARPTTVKPATIQTTTRDAMAAANSAALATVATDNAARSGMTQLAAALPALFSHFAARPTFTQARGVVAYQLSLARNAGLRSAPAPSAG
jgi:hypothetical protein